MHLFYCPDIYDSKGKLSPEESTHCVRILRLKTGDNIYLTDGKGNMYEAVIVSDNPNKCIVEMIRKLKIPSGPVYSIHIGIAPTKNIDRFEWFIEKSVELGIDIITPLLCQRSERRILKTERLRNLVISSMKQAIVSVVPVLNEFVDFKEFLGSVKNTEAMKFIAHCNDQERKNLRNTYVKSTDAIILIGPEGDFTPDEIDLAAQNGFIPVILSKNRLRTETAGIVACHAIHMLNEE